MNQAAIKLTLKDYTSNQEVRWCPGCGDYAILKALQRTMPEFDLPKENFVFVSGIGCAARFPYYMSTYGFHTIHGRAPAFATGIKLTNPALDPFGKIPEFKYCAARVEAVSEGGDA